MTPKSLGVRDDPDSEMVLPEAVDHDARRQRIVLARQPVRQRRPPPGRRHSGRRRRRGVAAAEESREAGRHFFLRPAPIAALASETSAAPRGPRRTRS